MDKGKIHAGIRPQGSCVNFEDSHEIISVTMRSAWRGAEWESDAY
jgi:hypothetical protein